MNARRIASAVLAACGCLCVAVALVAGYTSMAVLDSGQFADRATSALREAPVRDLIAREITDQVVLRSEGDLVAVRPLVQTAAESVVATSAFRALVRTAARDVHRTVFTRDSSTVTLTIADVGVLLASALRQLDAKAAARLPADFTARVEAGEEALRALDAAGYVDRFEGIAWMSAIAAVLLLAAAIAVAPRRRRAVVHVGVAVAVAGGIVMLASQIVRAEALARSPLPLDRAAADAIWDAFMGDLRTWALVALGAGTVVAAAAASLLRPVDVRRPLQHTWELARTVPANPWPRAGRALALVAAGALIVLERRWVLDAAVVLVGAFVLYQGVEELLRMVTDPSRRRRGDHPPDGADAQPRALALWMTGGVAVVLLTLLGAALLGSGGTRPAAASADAVTACNGHAELCDRTLNDVVFPMTHNSMSGQTYPNWMFAQQETGIRQQLDDGVRGLMLDTYFGQRVRGRVLTELPGSKLDVAKRELGESGTAAALRFRDSLVAGNAPRGPRDTWLCHGFCEVGSISLLQGLREVAEFAAANPHEVVVIVMQDEGPGPRDVAAAVDESGLRQFVYTGRVGAPWPTLREMIDSGGRVLVTFENGPADPAVPWYREAYALMQETPYHFDDPSRFTCEPNRGPSDASLFLLNHWIDTSPAPRPSNAAIVNARGPLLGRARECQREREMLPNFVAVDFYRTGDVFSVVDTLNAVGAPAGASAPQP